MAEIERSVWFILAAHTQTGVNERLEVIVEKFPLNVSGVLATRLREVVASLSSGFVQFPQVRHADVIPGVWKTS